MRNGPRAKTLTFAVLVLSLVIVSATGAPGIFGQGHSTGSSDCAQTAAAPNASEVEAAVGRARPGEVVCVRPGNYGSRPIEIKRSGKEDAPIRLQAQGHVVVAGFRVRANHVSITGFEITSPTGTTGRQAPGISLRGEKLLVSENVVHDTAGDGIVCAPTVPSCVRVKVSRNTIRRADGTGIVVFGRNNSVVGNDIAESVRVRASDADGIRFFGTGHVFRANRIHDISDDGYPGEPPHTDCFQTFDNDRPPTVDVVIDSNICDNVDHQCLIAEAQQSAKSQSLQFTNNICRNLGSQGLLIEKFPDVVVAFNVFAETIEYRAAFFLDGSLGGMFMNNIVDGSYRAYEVDASSTPGWRTARNLRHVGQPTAVRREVGVENVNLSLAGPQVPLEQRYRPVPGSLVIDAGVVVPGVERDASGIPRPLDGGTGSARVDVGPYEFRSVERSRR
jgi:hypothetical protein